MSVKSAPAPTVKQSDPMAELMASLVPADLSLFTKPVKAPKINEYIPVVVRSVEGKDAEGNGAPFQFPVPFGESAAVTAKLRRAGRDKGYAVQVRWTAVDGEGFDAQLKLVSESAEGTPAGQGARQHRDAHVGMLAFRTIPQVKRNGTVGA